MADYTPPFPKGEITTSTASAAVAGGDLLEVSGNGTVAKTATLGSMKVVGVAASDVAINGRVSFWGRGPVHESLADGTVTAGDQVTSTSTAGRGVKTALPDANSASQEPTVYDAAHTAAAVDLARSILGVALTSAADGGKVRWMLFG
jgi:hypothetical protein